MHRESTMTKIRKAILGFLITSILISSLSYCFIQLTEFMVPLDEFDSFTNEKVLAKNPSRSSVNHYETLGIPLFSQDEAIKRAYRDKLKLIHPDKFKGGKEEANLEVHRVTEAYKILTSKERCMYDFNLGSGIGRFADCNQKWLDRKNEELAEKRKEVKGKRNAQKQGIPQERKNIRKQETVSSVNALAKPSITTGQRLVQTVKDIGTTAKTVVLFVAGWFVVHFGRPLAMRFH
ncbi:DnaJ-domain-containing protein [Daldinia eschscholtzii]|nr:DnaJ-domain-containing protein [Daldinia eschscholtzii]